MTEHAFIDFLNSDWHDYRGSGRIEDRLDNPEWVKDYLSQWGLAEVEPPDADDLLRAKALRRLLRRMVDGLAAGHEPATEDLQALNQIHAASPLVQRLERSDGGYQIKQVPVRRDWNWALGVIASSLAALLVEGDRWRLKICDNPDCGWVFHDESRNRTRRWCEDATCGNLMKVRRFRARAREK